MAAWIPLIKTVLPYVAQVLSVAIPAFTSRVDSKKAIDIVPDQIAELQLAVTRNAESVNILAQQFKETIEGIDTAAVNIQREFAAMKRLCIYSIGVAVVSLTISIWTILSR